MIVNYNIETHEHMLAEWLRAHGLPLPPRSLFSPTGFCADGLAIGFLFSTSAPGQFYIDHVAADATAEKDKRDAALNKLFWHLESVAKQEGAVMVTALAKLPAMKRRFEAHGYSAYGEFSLYYKTLEGGA